MQELAEKVHSPATVFAKADEPYLQLCELYEAYGEVFCVDTKLTAKCRRANNVGKSDENDARVMLEVAEGFLAGRLPSGVWPFRPDLLRKAIRESERVFRAWQKLRGYPEWAESSNESTRRGSRRR